MTPTRLEATRALASVLGDAMVVASLGHPAYDLYAAADRPENFYTWGSMGLASSIGLGLAMQQPARRIVVLDGDGSLLMNLGSLATIATVNPPNLVVVVWDNELYATTGGQPTATAGGSDLAAAGRALGIQNSREVRSIEELLDAMRRSEDERAAALVVAKVRESAPIGKPPLDCVFLKQRFMAAIGCAEEATRGTQQA
jgi:thiamine pyrophosphate-dependent acetolactate synthase large subunit-like protein